jgi:S1-C subfamily serine protease
MIRTFFFIVLLIASTATLPLKSGDLSEATIKNLRKAAVEIHIKGQLRGGGAFVQASNSKTYVITAAHLFLDPKDTCRVVTEDEKSFSGSLSAYDLGHDLALIDLSPEVARYGTLTLAEKIPPDTTPIYNLGPALHRRTLLLSGSVADSRISYTDFTASRGSIAHFFASGINPALTSGGIWVNKEGAIVGLQHGRLIGDKGAPSSGISMVSPPQAIKMLLHSRKTAKTPGIGAYLWEVWTANHEMLKELPKKTEGLILNPVFKDRPIERAGLKALDVIVAVDGQSIRRRHEFFNLIRSKPPGSSFSLQVLPQGSETRRSVELVTDTLEDHWGPENQN